MSHYHKEILKAVHGSVLNSETDFEFTVYVWVYETQ